MKLNIGIWGTSKHAIEKILPNIKNNKNLNFIGFLSRKKKKISYQGQSYLVFNNKDKFLSANMDLVIIVTPPALHYENCKNALDYDKNILVEKPITINYQDTIELCKIAQKKNLLLIEGFYYQESIQCKKLNKLIQDIGNAEISMNLKFGIPSLERKSFRSFKNLGASSFWDIGCYPISFISNLFTFDKVKVIKTNFSFDQNNLIDSKGFCLLYVNANIKCYLEWGIGMSYKNSIDVWSENISFCGHYVFSKPEKKKCIIEIFNKYGEKKVLNFYNMNYIDIFFKNICKNFYNKSFKESKIIDIKKNANLQKIILDNLN